MPLDGYYNQIHFKCNDLELFYNLPVITSEDAPLEDCPHIDGLVCSRAHELAPDKCKTERKCEILELKDELFRENGIHARALRDLDAHLRKS